MLLNIWNYSFHSPKDIPIFALLFLLFVAPCVVAGEKEDSPMTHSPSNSFGSMIFDSREKVDVSALESAFLSRVELKQDQRCTDSGSPELRRMTFLEFRKFVFSKIYIQDQEIKSDDLVNFSKFLEIALVHNGDQVFQMKSAYNATAKKLIPFPKASAFDNNVQQFLTRVKSPVGVEILSDIQAEFGILNVKKEQLKSDTFALIKAFQIKAKIEPAKVLKECRTNLFTNESLFYLSEEMKTLSKCFIEKDLGCFGSWMTLCPSIQVSHYLENMELYQKTSEKFAKGTLCQAAFQEVVDDTLKKEPSGSLIKVSNKQ